MRFCAIMLAAAASFPLWAEVPTVFSAGQLPGDRRLGELQNLNGYFPFQPVADATQWQDRRAQIRRRILISQGLWPMPTRSPLRAVIHGRVEREDYFVDRVYFESIPGHYVTGSLYRPKGKAGRRPAILSPHGHWSRGRFYDAGNAHVQNDLKIGAEQFEIAGRYPIQARAVQLARLGCIVLVYDMTGNADSIQIQHRPERWSHLDRKTDWGFMSVQAELRLQNMMGLQTWNSIRAIDFLLELDDVDPARIGVTGASGGGTQSMIIGAIDERIAAAMPCVMVSTAMQGGCTCENAPLLRIDQGNVDIAAAIAPRPLGLTAADDWTVELKTKGYPDLVKLYRMLGHPNRLTAVFHTEFQHNYNQVNRAAMYDFFNRHFQLDASESIAERDFQPLSVEEATVWTNDHPPPQGDQVGDAHEVRILKLAAADAERKLAQLLPTDADQLGPFRRIVGGAWETILGRRLSDVGTVNFQPTDSQSIGNLQLIEGVVDHVEAGEQLPVFRLRGETSDKPIVIWVADQGKQEVFDGDRLIGPAESLIDAGHEIIVADLFGQGEFVSDNQSWTSQPMWYQRGGETGWHRFAGYTFGYNHPLFVKRVHDLLSLIKLAEQAGQGVVLVGIGPVAGPLAAAARSQTGDLAVAALIDLAGFQFAALDRHDHPMFVPGAVKYLGVEGLIALAAPAPLIVTGLSQPQSVQQTYRAAGAAEALTICVDRAELISHLAGRASTAGR